MSCHTLSFVCKVLIFSNDSDGGDYMFTTGLGNLRMQEKQISECLRIKL